MSSLGSDLEADLSMEKRFRGTPGLPSKTKFNYLMRLTNYNMDKFRVYNTINGEEAGGTDELQICFG